MKRIQVRIEGKLIELFKDESIVINSSVQNIKDISKVFTDYSQSFTVPASNNNNQIFKHFYNADIDGGFDARTKKDATIEISHLPFKEGKIQLESVQIEDNKPKHYKINFTGNLVSLTEKFGDDTLSDLDFNSFDHLYNYNNVKSGLTFGHYGSKLIYPLISTTRQFYYTPGPFLPDHTSTEKLVNITHHSGHASDEKHGVKWNNLKPAILVKELILTIENKYDINFDSVFFQSPVFDNLFLWLAKEKGSLIKQTRIQKIDLDQHLLGDAGFDLNNDWYQHTLISGTNTVPKPYDERLRGKMTITPAAGFEEVKYSTFQRQVVGGPLIPILTNVTDWSDSVFETRFFENRKVPVRQEIFIQSSEPMTFTAQYNIVKEFFEPSGFGNHGEWRRVFDSHLFKQSQGTSGEISISEIMPQMKVKDFLSGIVKMYNLTIVPNSATDFTIEPLNDWYARGKIIDISNYVYTSSSTVAKGKILKNINFKFKENETFLIDAFKNIHGRPYGDLESIIKDDQGKQLDGDKLEIKVPFSNMLFERLQNTNIQYGLSTTSSIEETVPKNLLFYGIKKNISSNPICLIDENGNENKLNANLWMPFHVNNTDTKEFSTVFNAETEPYTNTQIDNSLFRLYYQDYITDIFSEKRRVYSYTGKLPDYLLSNLKLNDRLVIKGTRYLINTIQTNLTTNNITLSLLNDIYTRETQIKPPPIVTKAFSLKIDNRADDACNGTPVQVYFEYSDFVSNNQNFRDAKVLYSDSSNSTLALWGWYSDGDISRHWNGTKFVENVYTCGTVITTLPKIKLSYGDTPQEACLNFANGKSYDFYVDPQDAGKGVKDISKLYADYKGDICSLTHYYSDGNWSRLWYKDECKFILTTKATC